MASDFTILAVKPDDFREIMRIEKEYIECAWSEANIKAALSDNRYSFFKAECVGQIKGYIGVEWCLDEGSICNVAVTSDARRRGIATALINSVINEARCRGTNRLLLEVNEKNYAATALYKKIGFTEISRRGRYYGDDGAVVMEMTLQ